MRKLALLGFIAVFAALVVATLVGNVFGVDDGSRLLLTVLEFLVMVVVLAVVMSVLPRHLQQRVAGAQPTSAMMRRRLDGLMTALGALPARSARADFAALRSGLTLYARAVRLEGMQPSLGVLLLDKPGTGPGRVRWLEHGTVQNLQTQVELVEVTGVPPTLTARTFKATSTVWLGHDLNLQLTPMDLEVLRHVLAEA
ncbi:hypothetical protein ACFW1A_23055 [Kitasatospora sp. NPDC058965]|uniref:hypothetical protein n=1 Tax=Kitasatospora sp. NPDC058965 TaxID=3346682 RepID=UPI0036C4DAF5